MYQSPSVLRRVHAPGYGKLPKIVEALHGGRIVSGSPHRGQEQHRAESHERHDNEQFNQGECFSLSRSAEVVCRFRFHEFNGLNFFKRPRRDNSDA
jgi:hypothetical protein